MKKLALITGASGGLSRVLCRLLADKGWHIALVSRDADSIQEITKDAGGHAIEADVSSSDGADYALNECVRVAGIPDALINCAGQVCITALNQTTDDQYRSCMSANIDTAFFILRAYVQTLLTNKASGAAVLISTVAAQTGVQNHEVVSASKAAIEGLVRSAAASYSSKGLRINAIAPGLMDTQAVERLMRSEASRASLAKQYPLGRYGQPEDIASAIVWLLSDEASWITGQIIPVDGGFSAVRPLVR